mmetsp:Transcript_61771/g.172685  ORF Transcript_61771/g.172685 Transcript_61771/m.172685 type:complete len:121 (+) Transcript_61771:64-426(+)
MRFVLALLSGILLATSEMASGLAPGVTIDGKVWTVADIESKRVVIEGGGKFIVVCKEGTKDKVMEAMKEKFDWSPGTKFSMMPMFAGHLAWDQIVFMLQMPEVEAIENDGVVRALVRQDL